FSELTCPVGVVPGFTYVTLLHAPSKSAAHSNALVHMIASSDSLTARARYRGGLEVASERAGNERRDLRRIGLEERQAGLVEQALEVRRQAIALARDARRRHRVVEPASRLVHAPRDRALAALLHHRGLAVRETLQRDQHHGRAHLGGQRVERAQEAP